MQHFMAALYCHKKETKVMSESVTKHSNNMSISNVSGHSFLTIKASSAFESYKLE